MGRGWFAALALAAFACDDGAGDAACPENTVRTGTMCLPVDDGGVVPDMGQGGAGGTDMGQGGGGGQGGMGDLTLPLIVDDHYAPSGFMGDGEDGGIVSDNACPMRAGDEGGQCHRFVFTPGMRGWAGIFWQYPDGNWGDAPGLAVPAGATRLQFYAWGAEGGEQVRFVMGYGETDGFAVETDAVALTTEPTLVSIDIAGVPYETIAGGLAWFLDAGATFYMDDIRIVADPNDTVDPCTVSCATLQGLGECEGKIGYGLCKQECARLTGGDCSEQAAAWLTCVGDAGYACEGGTAAPANGCADEIAAVEACDNANPQLAELPFYIEEHFVMSGFMGGGDVAAEPCPGPMADEGGQCLAITWTPGEAAWVGFFFQHPENNWGELPGLGLEPGATHVRWRAWGATGSERANFAVGINDVDSFSVESGYGLLNTEPTDFDIAIPPDTVEVRGGFAWFLEANGADSVTFYLDDVQWRDDPLPGGENGCTDANAENYSPAAERDDGSCEYRVRFSVDMNCHDEPFETVFMTGPFCEWCADGFQLTDDDNDGTYEGEFVIPGGDFEYKYMVDGFEAQENLLDDVQAGNGACAPVTDGANFANRQARIEGPVTLDDTYGQCQACGDEPPPPPPMGAFQTITFDDPAIMYSLIGFGGADDSQVIVDPTNAENMVGQVVKADNAEVWAGTTVATRANDAAGRIAFDAENTRMSVRVWSPHANIQVRLKVEDSTDPAVSVETEATVTLAEQWEELTFDFNNQADGTAALNLGATYDKVSIFFNFGVDGATAGNRIYYFDDLAFIGGGDPPPPPPDMVDVTFRADMNCHEGMFETVFVTGPFCEWCAEGFPLADEDGDGIWEATYQFPAGPLEYKYMVDGFADQENLVDDVAAGNGACAPVTDGMNFANRLAQLAGNTVLADTYGQCGACGDEPPPPPPVGDFETITFDDADIEYRLIGFGGAEDSGVEVDPTDAGNMVGRVTKSDMAELWAGATVATRANDAAGRIAFDAENTRMTVRVWSPHAGIQVRLKVEDASDPTVSVETEATSMVANDWEELTFDFANQADGTAAINFAATYDKVSIFFNFGQTGADAGARTYYFDDVAFVGGGGGIDPPPPGMFDVTFRVDTTCEAPDDFGTVFVTGPFCDWCAEGFPLADEDGDGIWEGTYAFPAGPFEYKYMVDGFADQENLVDDVAAGNGACAPVTDGANFANRQFMLNANTLRDETYGRCDACDDGPPPPPVGDFETITFDDPDIEYRLIGFGGAEDSAVEVDPTDAGNMVGRLTKGDAAELWAGATVATGANDAAGRIAFDAENTRMTVRVWSPHADIQVRLKVEDSTDPTVSVETEATVTVANDWEELTFDFANQADGTAAIDFGATYDKVTIFFNFGVTGADAGARTYYFDDIAFGGEGGIDPPPPPPPVEAFETITFDDPDIMYSLIGFGGAEDSAVEVDPTDAGNMVGRLTKSDAAELWAGATVATRANDAAGPIPFAADNTRMTARVWSPHADIQVRVKVEDSTNPAVSVETEATVTVANDWEELTFDFANQADGTAAIDFGATYDKVTIFFNFGVTGADAGARTYYFDDIAFGGEGGVDPPPPPPPADAFETITFDDPEIMYALIGFGGAEDSAVEVDPTDAGNMVGRLTKSDAAELWAGATVATRANDAAGPIPFGPGNTRMTARVWSPHADIQVRVKVEDSTNPAVSVETEATVTVANDWEELTFDFANQADGTAAIDFGATYDKVTIFFNFGVTGADAGARTYYFDDIAFGGEGGVDPPPPAGPFDVTFRVDMNCEGPDNFGTVYVTGPFCDWCADGFALADEDGDGIWEGTFPFDAGPLEYKYMVDNWAAQEDLVDDVQAGDGACAPVTDGAGFANRQFMVAADTERNEIYGRCSACEDEPPPPPPADAFETITFDDPDIMYSLIGFGGAEDSGVEVDPTDAGNMVGRLTKSDAAELWAGATVATRANDAAGPIPFAADNTRMTARVWSPHADIQVRVKVEDSTNPAVSVETEATVTVANDWEELTFDFANQADGTAAIDFGATYDKVTIFFNFGVTGADAGARTYYFDDIAFGGEGGVDPPPPPPPADAFETITFDDPEIMYALIGFGGAEDSAVEVDPTDAGNMVGRLTKSDAAELWAGATVATRANDAAGPIPFGPGNTRMTARVWSPHADIQVRVKVEDSTNPAVSVETEATVTVANDWEELTFDFANQADGTAAIDFGATYDKVTIFFNFGVTGADAGARTYYFDDIAFGGEGGVDPPPPAGPFDVTFRVDMNCEGPDNFGTVYVTGPFCNWCAEGFALADEDGDGIWEGTFPFDAGPLEYKYMVDNWAAQEDLVDDVQAGDGACAPVTDGAGFANRQFMVAADTERNEIYGRCSACEDEPPPPPPPADAFETITFDDPGVMYSLIGFGGAEDSAVEVDPTDAGNMVGRLTKSDAAELWAGATVATQANQAAGAIPFDADNTRMTVQVWSPHAEIQVRLKVEDSTNPAVSVETEATVTVANDWEELTFDFANQVDGTAAIDFGATYDKVTIFFNFGVTGADAGARTYYFDDIAFDGAGVEPPPPPPAGEVIANFDEPGVDYAFAGFGGAEDSGVVADPTDPANNVVRVVKAGNAELWAGTTFATELNLRIERLAFDLDNTQIRVRVWSPHAGIQVRLKVEDSNNPAISVETEATVTVANAWEVLVFNFTDEVVNTPALDFGANYDRASIFFNFGVTGAEAGERTYYFDDVVFGGAAPPPPPPPAGILALGFDDVNSIDNWEGVADASNSMEASLSWQDGRGNPGGALLIGGDNSEDRGKAYIFQYNTTGVDYGAGGAVRVSFDARLDGPLVGVAVHLQTNLPGVGVVNTFDIQGRGLNDAGWTRVEVDFDGVDPAGDFFGMHFNLATGAFVDAGGMVLIDNIRIDPLP